MSHEGDSAMVLLSVNAVKLEQAWKTCSVVTLRRSPIDFFMTVIGCYPGDQFVERGVTRSKRPSDQSLYRPIFVVQADESGARWEL
jgi:hypothetical protein